MHPVVHLAVGYLAYAGYTRWRFERPPDGGATLVLLFAAVLPDLIDKPLEWSGSVPVGRTIGHSILFAIPVVAVVWVLARRRGSDHSADAFAIGYLSHVAADVPWHVLSEDFEELGFLFWPVTEVAEYSGVKPVATIGEVTVTTLWIEAVILLAGIGLWVRDGAPGIRVARDAIESTVTNLRQ